MFEDFENDRNTSSKSYILNKRCTCVYNNNNNNNAVDTNNSFPAHPRVSVYPVVQFKKLVKNSKLGTKFEKKNLKTPPQSCISREMHESHYPVIIFYTHNYYYYYYNITHNTLYPRAYLYTSYTLQPDRIASYHRGTTRSRLSVNIT